MQIPQIILPAAIALAASGAAADMPIAVWNHAYQENTTADALAEILDRARHAYVLIDPFPDTVTASQVARLQSNGNQVAAYISVGTGEDWRGDFDQLQPALVAKPWGAWAGEYFVSDSDAALSVMKARIDTVASLGFDWVEFDNMDWVFDDVTRADYGVAASIAQGVAYTNALCDHVHARGMKCMAKSTVEGADRFDGVTYESYPDNENWWDQAGAAGFLAAGKPVIVVHYNETDCAGAYANYQAIYGEMLSFICEDPAQGGYVHFNVWP